MKPVRFLFDEHMPLAIPKALKRPIAVPDLLRVGQEGAPAFSTQDPDILVWCEENQRLFVSLDRSTLPVHFGEHLASGRHSWGVVLCKPTLPFSLVIEQLRAIAGASSAEEWLDRIVHLPL